MEIHLLLLNCHSKMCQIPYKIIKINYTSKVNIIMCYKMLYTLTDGTDAAIGIMAKLRSRKKFVIYC